MLVFLNGQFISEAQAVVSVFDRSFLYGDGLFETMRVFRGVPFRWLDHMARLEQGARLLNITLPYSRDQLRDYARQLIEKNHLPESLLRLTLSRGVGPRGYSPKGADHPTLVMTLHPAPDANGEPIPQWRVVTASFRLPANEPLALFKNCNKLPQIMARAQADASGADEALLLNTLGEVVEAASSNLFWIADNVVCTPPLNSGILAGVTRLVVLEICQSLNIPTRELGITPTNLPRVQGVFLSLSSWGIVEVTHLDNQPLGRSPLVNKLQSAYAQIITEHRS
ncbi:MAG: ilvE [Pedosphaera sp.]|nr:ilvE [Pedosphaera sp.]